MREVVGADDVNPEQHERVSKALEQINGLRYRYYSSPKEAKQVLSFDSDDDDDGSDALDRGANGYGGRRKKSKAIDDDDEDAALTFDDHIDRILRKTRTIALLKIANNTAEVLPEDTSFVCDLDAEFDGEDDTFDDDDSFETIDDRFGSDAAGTAPKPMSPLQCAAARGSFRHIGSMRSSASNLSSGSGSRSSSSHKISHEESAAAVRLVRTLSSFLSLPRVISYKDLEMITEKLLDEPSDNHDDYGDLIDFHVDSARDTSSAGGDAAADELPLWKRRNTNTIVPLALPDDSGDLELHQRRMFMEANRFNRFSSRNFLSASSSKSLLTRHIGSPLSSLGSQKGSFRSGDVLAKKESKLGAMSRGSYQSLTGSVAEEEDEGNAEASRAAGDGAQQDEPFDEKEYNRWRTEVKAEYLAWINAKLEAKRKRRESLKKEAGKKPRWLLLYEASRRPEPKQAAK